MHGISRFLNTIAGAHNSPVFSERALQRTHQANASRRAAIRQAEYDQMVNLWIEAKEECQRLQDRVERLAKTNLRIALPI